MAAINLACFLMLHGVATAASVAFVLAVALNYLLCISFLLRHRSQWNSAGEITVYLLVVVAVGWMVR